MAPGDRNELAGRHHSRPVTTLLSRLSAGVRDREASLVEEWTDLVTWANQNVVTAPAQAATIIDGVIDTGVPIAGDGAPLVSEFALMK